MNLNKKRLLAIRTLGVGKDRVVFNSNRLNEIKEAITKQDIRDLVESGAIIIKEIKGRKTVVRRVKRRKAGSVRKKIKYGKEEYMNLTRRFRAHIKQLRNKEEITEDNYQKLRKEIRAKLFRSKSNIRERITQLSKIK